MVSVMKGVAFDQGMGLDAGAWGDGGFGLGLGVDHRKFDRGQIILDNPEG